MRRIIITEEQQEDIMNSLSDDIRKIDVHLRRNYPIKTNREEDIPFIGKYYVLVDEKPIRLKDSFKQLVNKIDYEIKSIFSNVDDTIRRQTIKKYLRRFQN